MNSLILKIGIGLASLVGIISAIAVPLSSGGSSNKSVTTTFSSAIHRGGHEEQRYLSEDQLKINGKWNENDLLSLARVIHYELKENNSNQNFNKWIRIQKKQGEYLWSWSNQSEWIVEKARSSAQENFNGFIEVMKPALEHILNDWVIQSWTRGLNSQFWSSSWTSGQTHVVMTGQDIDGARYSSLKWNWESDKEKKYVIGIYKSSEGEGSLILGVNKCKDKNPLQCQIEKKDTEKKIKIVFESK